MRSIRPLVESARLASACVDCRLYADVADPNAITLLEEWSTQADMERRTLDRLWAAHAAFGAVVPAAGNAVLCDYSDQRPGGDRADSALGGTQLEQR